MNWYHWLGGAVIVWACVGAWIVRHEIKDWF